ncbi:MAG: flagellar hook-basal body complex protein FliE [Nitrospinota bacterium]
MKPGDVNLFSKPLIAANDLKSGKSGDADGAEKSFLETLGESIDEVNSLQLEAGKAAQELAIGESDNIHDVMIAMEKASVSFRMMAQVRNKVLEAYQEVMRMQV